MIEHLGELQDVRPADRSVSRRRAALVPRGEAALRLGGGGDGPIVTTDEPGCRETVLDGANGYLLSAHNVPQLTAAVARFIAIPASSPPWGGGQAVDRVRKVCRAQS